MDKSAQEASVLCILLCDSCFVINVGISPGALGQIVSCVGNSNRARVFKTLNLSSSVAVLPKSTPRGSILRESHNT